MSMKSGSAAQLNLPKHYHLVHHRHHHHPAHHLTNLSQTGQICDKLLYDAALTRRQRANRLARQAVTRQYLRTTAITLTDEHLHGVEHVSPAICCSARTRKIQKVCPSRGWDSGHHRFVVSELSRGHTVARLLNNGDAMVCYQGYGIVCG